MMLSILPNADVSYLDGLLLDANGRIRLLPASEYAVIDPLHLRLWSVQNARYCLPTTELIDWLKDKIAGRSAIEVAAGNGDLGFHLGIPATDSYCQRRPDVLQYYAFLKQAPTKPTADIFEEDAIQAIDKRRPQVVVAAWLTHKWTGTGDGNMYGPDEAEILDRVETYIHIGNEDTHRIKPILARKHESLKFPWLVSRAANPSNNIIYVFNA